MLDEIDRSLERWLRADVPLPPDEVEVKFEQPQKTWDARRATPMVDLFLYSLTKSVSRAETGSRVVAREGGGLARENVVPVVEARYLVTAWGGGPGVEHVLLGRIVNVLASSRIIPDEHQGDALRFASPEPIVSLAPDASTSLTLLWSGLGVPPRAGIQLLIYSPMALPVARPVADPPRALRLGFSQADPPAALAPRRRVFGTEATIGIDRTAQRATAVVEDSGREASTARASGDLDILAPDDAGDERG